MEKITYIILQSHDEVFIFTPDKEDEVIRRYFTEGGRDIEEFDRSNTGDSCVMVESRMAVC